MFFGSYVAVYQIVFRTMAGHVRAQNSLLNRCRSLYLRAIQHFNSEEKADANNLLIRIRRIEWVWTLGNSLFLRWAVILKGIAIAVIVAAVMRSVPLPGWSDRPPHQRFVEDLFSFITFVFVGPPLVHALLAVSISDWDELDLVKDCGDRLEQMLRAGDAVAIQSTKSRHRRKTSDGLSHRQVLGVGRRFTKAQLKTARNRMARQFHPDRSASSRPEVRTANDEAMKRVNAAYDALLAEL